jgi:hypothetical protein
VFRLAALHLIMEQRDGAGSVYAISDALRSPIRKMQIPTTCRQTKTPLNARSYSALCDGSQSPQGIRSALSSSDMHGALRGSPRRIRVPPMDSVRIRAPRRRSIYMRTTARYSSVKTSSVSQLAICDTFKSSYTASRLLRQHVWPFVDRSQGRSSAGFRIGLGVSSSHEQY